MKIARTASFALALAALACFAAPAMSQVEELGDIPSSVTKYTFDNELVEGDKVVPDGMYVTGDAKPKTSGLLIRVRRHFVVEMLKSVQDM